MSQERRTFLNPSPYRILATEQQACSSTSRAQTNSDLQVPLTLSALPPEVLEKIFGYLGHNVTSLRSVAGVCLHFHQIACKVGVTVNIPLSEEDLCWLRKYQVSVNQLNNSEISAFVGDQILGLNLGNCRGARLVGYDYQSRTCEVTPHYLNIVRALVLDAFKSLKKLELNIDLSKGRRNQFRFANLLCSFRCLKVLAIHFSAHIELNQRILNNQDAQELLDVVLKHLPTLTTLHIFIWPLRRLRVSSTSLREFALYKCDGVEITNLSLPSLKKIILHGSTTEMFRKILADRETGGPKMHRNLLSIIYDGCPNLRILNSLRLPQILCGRHRPKRQEWVTTVNQLMVSQVKGMPVPSPSD